MSKEKKRLLSASPLLFTLFSVLTGLLVGAVVLRISGYNPVQAYRVILDGIFSRPSYVAYTIIYSTPLILTGLSVAFAFRTGLFNIGAEGQFIIGALGAALAGAFLNLPPVIHAIVAALAGIAAAAIWGGIAGFLKARFGVNEVIATIMLNWTALYLNNYVVTLPGIKRPAATATAFILDSARIEILPLWKMSEAGRAWRMAHPFWHDILRTPLNAGILIALFLAFFCWWLLNRTTLGYELRAVGYNPDCSEHVGIDVKRRMISSMAIAGGLAGAAGALHVLGWTRQAAELAAMEGLGFDGIAVALIGGASPIGCIPAGLLFGALKYGGSKLQFALRAPIEVVNIVIGSIVFFVAMPRLLQILARRLKRKKETGGDSHAA
jgi:simple sugar transport system permease protein